MSRRFCPSLQLVGASLLVCILTCLPKLARSQFLYYSPMTVRSLGMGAVGSADPHDGTNAWANPAVISSVDNLGAAICYRSYSISSFDFTDFSALVGGSYSTTRFGATFGFGYHNETVGTEIRSDKDDAFHLLGAAHVTLSQLRFAVGLARKSYSLPSIANKDRNSLTDVGLMAAWTSAVKEHWHYDGSISYSWMNNGDEAQTELFGPIQIVSTERYGTWLAVHSPMRRSALVGEGPVSLLALSVAFDGERGTSRSEHPRYLFGSEITLWNLFVVRAGYVHDEILAQGARDASFGFGIHLANSRLSAQFDYGRFPVLHDVYSNSVGAELALTW
jgi:hypothetical protein